MALSAEVIALIEGFRKETEDLVYANITEIFLMKYGEYEALTAGAHTISFEGQAYDSDDDYAIGLYEAVDVDGINVKGEIEFTAKTANGFTIDVFRPCAIKWIAARKIPKINFWTD